MLQVSYGGMCQIDPIWLLNAKLRQKHVSLKLYLSAYKSFVKCIPGFLYFVRDSQVSPCIIRVSIVFAMCTGRFRTGVTKTVSELECVPNTNLL